MSKTQGKHTQTNNAIDQACLWLARLWADDATEKDHAACQAWRQAAPENEYAWQQVQQLQQRFQVLPDPKTGSKLLRQQKTVSRRQFLTYASLTLGTGLLATEYFNSSQRHSRDYTTRKGEIRKTVLADGTHLFLNTSTQVDINFSDQKREIRLYEGEIYVETAPHHLPFAVISREGTLRPLGTRFSVRLMPLYDQLAVYEGRVQIQHAQSQEKTIIEAGFGADFTQSRLLQNSTADTVNITWTTQKITATNMPLTQFISEISRYHTGKLRVSPKLSNLTVTGIFSLQDTTRILHQLTEILPVRLQQITPYWITLLPI